MKRKLQQLLITLLLGTSICSFAQIEGNYHSVGYFYHPTSPRAIYLDKALTKVTDSTYTTTIGDLTTASGVLVLNIHKNNTVTYENSNTINGGVNYSIIPTQDSINSFDPTNKIFNLHYQYTISGATRKVREVLTYFLSFKINDITYTTTSLTEVGVLKGDSCKGQVIIPPTVQYDGKTYTVKSIKETAFHGNDSIINVTLPETITSIGKYSFYNCRKLTSINIPNSVINIDLCSFNSCYALKDINIPSSVLIIGNEAFNSVLGPINIDGHNPNYSSTDGLLFNKDKSILMQCPTSISGQYTIPSTVQTIGISAFYCCSLTNVIIPNSVTTISDNAFSGSINLSNIIIPDFVKTIGIEAFYGCRLDTITIPTSVTSIGVGAFRYTSIKIIVNNNNPLFSSLDGVLYNKDKTILLQHTFYNSNITFVIPNTVKVIGEEAFYGNWFNYIIIPQSVTTIGYYAFGECQNLKEISIPESVDSIGDYAFWCCYGLAKISLPKSLKKLGNYVFGVRDVLNSIYVYATTPIDLSTSTNVFYEVNKTTCTLYVPKGSLSLYQSANQWKDFSNIVEFDATAVNNPNNTSLKVYYNQTTGSLQLNGVDSPVSVSVYALNGRLCIARTLMTNEAINLKSLPRGMYMIKAVVNNEVVTQKVIL